MKRVNNFEITGNCVADAKLYSFSTGKQKATFSVAVNYVYETTQEGEKKSVAEFFNVETWDKNVFDLIKKGAPLVVKGFRKGNLINDKPYYYIVATSVEAFVLDPKEK